MHIDGKGMHTDRKGKISFQTHGQTDRQTDQLQVHMLSCALAAKNKII